MPHNIKLFVSRSYGEKNPDFRIFVDELEVTPIYGAAEEVGEHPILLAEEVKTRLGTLAIPFERGELIILPAPTADCPEFGPVLVAATTQSKPLTPRGGLRKYNYFLSTGAPEWLSVDRDSGVVTVKQPPAPGIFPYTILVESDGHTGKVHCYINVIPQPTCCCPTISAVANNEFSATLTGSGGVGPDYSFTPDVNLPLPSWLCLSGSTLSGTPPDIAVGPSSFSVEVTDSANNSNIVNCTIQVIPPPTCCCPPTSVVAGGNFKVKLKGGGGLGPGNIGYKFALASNPSWLEISGDSICANPPTDTPSHTCSYAIEVTDGNGKKGKTQCQLVVIPQFTVSLNGTPVANNPFAGSLTGGGGLRGPYLFTPPNAALPDGLQMSNDGKGAITGTPSTDGSLSFPVTVEDSGGNSGPATCTFAVLAAPSATWTSIPAVEGESIGPVIPKTSGGVTTGTPWTYSAAGLPRGVEMDAQTGAISGRASVTGPVNFKVRITDSAGNQGSAQGSFQVIPREAAQLAQAQAELARAMARVQADINTSTSTPQHEALRDLSVLQDKVSTLLSEMRHAPHTSHGEHGFHVQVPLEFLDQNVQVELHHPGNQTALLKETPDEMGNVIFRATPGAKHELWLIVNGHHIQTMTEAAS